MLSVFVSIYANIIPGVAYGIMYSISYIVFMFPITCNPPNISPDAIINVVLFVIIFFILCLNTISSINGAKIAAWMKIYIGDFVSVS